MKQFILFLFVLLPFCVTSQVNEAFDGSELGPDWIGKDRDSFKINKEGRLQLVPGGKSVYRKGYSVFGKYAMGI